MDERGPVTKKGMDWPRLIERWELIRTSHR